MPLTDQQKEARLKMLLDGARAKMERDNPQYTPKQKSGRMALLENLVRSRLRMAPSPLGEEGRKRHPFGAGAKSQAAAKKKPAAKAKPAAAKKKAPAKKPGERIGRPVRRGQPLKAKPKKKPPERVGRPVPHKPRLTPSPRRRITPQPIQGKPRKITPRRTTPTRRTARRQPTARRTTARSPRGQRRR